MKAIIFDCFGVLYLNPTHGFGDAYARNQVLIDYAQTLRGTHKVGMLSNIGIQGMNEYFSEFERRSLFDATVLSDEVGHTKPHPRIYEIIAEKLDLSTGACVMIDDLKNNCLGAEAVGMSSIQFETNEQLRRDLEKLLAKE